MSDRPLLSVRGETVLEVDPEVARLSVTIAARDADRAKAMRLLNERGASIDGVLGAFRDMIERTETTAVRVSPQLKSRKPQERISGYVATVSYTITVGGFARLGELIAQLANQDLAEVAGPWWSLRPDSPARRTARIAAVHDAVRRARDYARAVSSELTELVELADVGMASEVRSPMAFAAMDTGGMARSHQAAAPDEFTFDIVPVKQTVHAAVEARFRLSPPDLSSIGD